MLPDATNILDQLLGGFETKPFSPIGSSDAGSQGESSGPLFGDLLTRMMLGHTKAADYDSFSVIDKLFSPKDRPVAQDGAPAGPTVGLLQLVGAISGPVVPTLPNLDGNEDTSTPTVCDSTVDSMSGESLPQFVELSAARRNITRSLTDGTGFLEPDVYNVLEVSLEDGRLELTLAPQGGTADPVRVSLPLSVLAQFVSEHAAKNAAVSKVPNGLKLALRDSNLELDKLFKALNLKTLNIHEPMTPAKGGPSSMTLELTLIGEDQGARFAITARINKQDVLLKPAGNVGGDLAAVTGEDEPIAATRPMMDTSSQNDAQDHTLPFKKAVSEGTLTLTKNLLPEGKPLGFEASFSSASLDNTSPSMSTMDHIPTPAPVKLSLPENIMRSFASQGQTITIRIEPEHLGPARLNLTVRDQMLTARVTVDTAAAKMAVEGSLSELSDQLSRAGIQVDRIDVVLGDSNTPHRFPDRRPTWSQSRRMRQPGLDDRMPSDTLSIPLTMMPPRQYVGAQGVNLLA